METVDVGNSLQSTEALMWNPKKIPKIHPNKEDIEISMFIFISYIYIYVSTTPGVKRLSSLMYPEVCWLKLADGLPRLWKTPKWLVFGVSDSWAHQDFVVTATSVGGPY